MRFRPFRRIPERPVLLRAFAPRSEFVLYPSGIECRGTCGDCVTLASGSSLERTALLELLAPLHEVAEPFPLSERFVVFSGASPRVQHLYVSELRFRVASPSAFLVALLFPDLSHFDRGVLLTWVLEKELASQPAGWDGLFSANPQTLTNLCHDASWRPYVEALLGVYADVAVWRPSSLRLPLEYSMLGASTDLKLAALSQALLVSAFTSQDARPALQVLKGADEAFRESFVALARDFTTVALSTDAPADLYQLLDLARILSSSRLVP